MLSCVIIDDEPKAIGIIARCIEKIPYLHLSQTFRDGSEALLHLSQFPADIIFLDISMPGINGLEIARLIPESTKIIFTTAYHEHALEGFELNAVDYLLKPVTFERFTKAIVKLEEFEKIRQKLSLPYSVNNKAETRPSDFIFLKSGITLHKVIKNHILFFEKDGNYFRVHLKDKSILIRMNFSDLQKLVPPEQFIRVHKSYIVNLSHVDRIESGIVYIKNTEIPVSANYKNDFSLALKRDQ